MDLSEDVRLSLDDKADFLAKRVHDLSVESKCRAYAESHVLPDSDRRNAVLQAWDDYREQQLGPLVKEAASLFASVLEYFPGPYEKRKAFVSERVIASVIEPAMELTRSWFWWACNGKVLYIDHERPPDNFSVERPLAHWAAPLWLDPGRPARAKIRALAGDASDFITDQEATLRLRLSQILEWAIKGCVLWPFSEVPSSGSHQPARSRVMQKASSDRDRPFVAFLADFLPNNPEANAAKICCAFDKTGRTNLQRLKSYSKYGRNWEECYLSGDSGRSTVSSQISRWKKKAIKLPSAACSKIM